MERSAFFNSINGDRKYKAEIFAGYFSKFITNGIFPLPENNLRVCAYDRMKIRLFAGTGYINGYLYENTDFLILTIETADGVNPRIDRVVLEWNQLERCIKAVVKTGVPSAIPVAPLLVRDADIYELSLATVSVPQGAYEIREMDITDTRLNTDECGIVNSILQADTSAIFHQYEDWFNRTSENYEVTLAGFIQSYNTAKNQWLADMEAWFLTTKTGFTAQLTQSHNEYKLLAKEYLSQIELLIGDTEAGELLNRVRWLQENLGFIPIDGGENFESYYDFSPDGGVF